MSLLADIEQVMSLVNGKTDEGFTGNSVSQLRAYRGARLGSRAARLTRVVRVIRLVRIVKLYKSALAYLNKSYK